MFSILLSGQTTVNYKSSDEIIANPERGFQKYSITDNSYNTKAGYSNLNQNTLIGWRTGDDKVTVIFRYFLMNSFLTSDISALYLQNIQKDFDIIRASGLKCIVRFSYSNSKSSSAQQPEKSQILKHIAQIAPILSLNKDLILTHQAGFIGTWGEWYYTNADEFGTEDAINETQWASRKEIIEAMLLATPPEIPLQVRYPNIKKTMYGSEPLTEATAYQNTAHARIGFFNDAFLNKWGDMGTYSVDASGQNPVGTADYIYLSNETQFTPMTGETNGLNSPRTGGANAVIEMNATNWTTLNRDYYTQNFYNWISSGHYPEIVKRLGYRFVLDQSVFTFNGNSLQLNLTLHNEGYARIFKARTVYLIIKNVSTGELNSFPVKTDIRTWSDQVKINQTFELSNLADGNYACYISITDADNNLSKRPEYCIRFANENVWNEAEGFNNLNFSFQLPLTSGIKSRGYLSEKEDDNIGISQTNQKGKITISWNHQFDKPANLIVTDLTGKRIINSMLDSNTMMKGETVLDTSVLNRGIYLIIIRNEKDFLKGTFFR
jgi:hypothetical protein